MKSKRKAKSFIILGVIVVIIAAVAITAIVNKDKIKQIFELKDGNVVEKVVEDIVEEPEPEIDVEFINEKLANVSSLQTAKITYGCMVDFKEGSVPLISQNAFSMYYEATAYASVDVSKIKCEKKDGKFILTLPEPTIQDPNINPDSLEFYDVKNSLLKENELNDVAVALQLAKKDFYYQQTTYQLLDMADKNAVDVLTNLLLCLIGEDDFEIVSSPRSEKARISPPIAANEKIEVDYIGLKEMFENAGFTNITLKPIKDVKIGLLTKEGEVESVTIDGGSSFRKTSVFDAEAEVVITYHTKE